MTDDLSPSEVARRIGTSTRTVQRWIERGQLPARRVGGRWRVASDAVDAFTAPPRSPAAPIRPITRLFVANRGEIAARIRRTGDRLGIATIVPDTAGPGALDLLDVDAVVAAAVATGADAVHPGFGFLAESADFARAVEGAGLRWVGPPPAAIEAMGDKAGARRLATRLGVPTLPGYDGDDQSDKALLAAADELGLPILVKPAAGGGGKGMRAVRDRERLADAFAGARREARASFGDDRLVLERLLEGPRHVEVQVLFDGHAAGVHLGERDCSIQRRHQKILEETPSPAVSPELRSRMTEAAVRLASGVGYVSAGTVEFLLDDRGDFHFLEMNTRLQVEHPVTELVLGLDLVAEQLRIAAGEPLGYDQSAVDARRAGHAAEVRLYAEDADAGFLPATGRVERLRWPVGDGVRVDAGIEEGDEITGRFDPMLAKIVAHGPTRDVALDRLAAALDATVVLGVTTNLRFLRWLVRHDAIRRGEARIDTLERIWPPDGWSASTVVPHDAWTVAAALLREPLATGVDDPWRGGWRTAGPATIRVESNGDVRSIGVVPDAHGARLPAMRAADGSVHVDVDGHSVAFRLARPPDEREAERAAAGHLQGGAAELHAPMPGLVVSVHVEAGSVVAAGDPVITLEAMKMEHVVAAPSPGRIERIDVRPGDQVTRGQPVAALSGEAEP